MKKFYKIFLFCSLFTSHFSLVSAQQHKVDSLLGVLNNTKEDTARLRVYLQLGDVCAIKDKMKYAELAEQLCDKLLVDARDEKERKLLLEQKVSALQLVSVFYGTTRDTTEAVFKHVDKLLDTYKELKDTSNMIDFILQSSDYQGKMGNFPKAIEFCQRAMKIAKEMDYKKGMVLCMIRMAELYDQGGDKELAIETLKKCIQEYASLKNGSGTSPLNLMARAYVSLGVIYGNMRDSAKALNCYKEAMKLFKKAGEKDVDLPMNLNIADVYKKNGDLPKALIYLNKAESLVNEQGDKEFGAYILDETGNIYIEQGIIAKSKHEDVKCDTLMKKALNYHTRALKINEEVNSINVAFSNYCLGRTYYYLGDLKRAKEHNDKFLERKLMAGRRRDGEYLAYRIDSSSGNYKAAFIHYQNYNTLNTKLNNEDVKKLAAQQKFQNEFDKQKAEQAQKDAVAEAEKKKQRIISSVVASGLILALIFAGFVVRSLRTTRKQNVLIAEQKQLVEEKSKIVEEKNKDILDSIAYAKRLQDAILPPLSLIKQYLPESFLLYKPKDIVAGDFYWMEPAGDNILIAAADCTGHGVPGAMVSVVCSNALNRTVKEFKITEPGKVLDKVRELVLETFEKSEDNVQDGMDISFASLTPSKGGVTLQWAGAYNSLWYLENGVIKELPADKQPIGKTDNPKPFTTHTLSLPIAIGTHSSLYLFTDGYADQFGGPKGKKFKYKQLQELLMVNCELSMNEQKQKLEETLNSWKGSLEQVDDILIIGIRV